MQKFNEKYNLRDFVSVRFLMDRVSDTHEALQQLEAGAKATPDQKAEATFLFLDLIGYLPTCITRGGKEYPIVGAGLAGCDGDRYFVEYETEDGKVTTFPLTGPKTNPKTVMLGVRDLTKLINLSFPKAIIQMSTGMSKKGHTVYHTTIRPVFMQEKSLGGFPVESGSAVCSDASVSLMQAATRMIAAHLIGAMCSVFLVKDTERQQAKKGRHAEVYSGGTRNAQENHNMDGALKRLLKLLSDLGFEVKHTRL